MLSALSYFPEKMLDLAKYEKTINNIIADSMTHVSVKDAFEVMYLAETEKRINRS